MIIKSLLLSTATATGKAGGNFLVVSLKLLEHESAKWLSKETLRSVNWLPADQLILDKIEKML